MKNHRSPLIGRDLVIGDVLTEVVFMVEQYAVMLQEVVVRQVEPKLAMRYTKTNIAVHPWNGAVVSKRLPKLGRTVRALSTRLESSDGEGVAQALVAMAESAERGIRTRCDAGMPMERIQADRAALLESANKLRAHGPVPRKV